MRGTVALAFLAFACGFAAGGFDGSYCPPEAGLGASPSEVELQQLEELAAFLKQQPWGGNRPPLFLFPGLASSRLVAWRGKKCIGPDIAVQDNIWLNIAKVVETLTFDPKCWLECLKLGTNQTDPGDCKVRAGEGLDAVSVLAPGLFTERATTVYGLLLQYVAENFGYDSGSVIGFPYDWRLSPGKMEERDGFFSKMKTSIEAAVRQHRRPGIVVAHSMGNNVVRYLIQWLQHHYPKSWESWVRGHLWTYVALAPPLLGSVMPLKSVLTGEPMGLPITDRQARELELSFGVTHWINPVSAGQANGTLHRAGAAAEGHSGAIDWDEELITVVAREGSATASFGASDVESGELFRWMGAIYNDEELSGKYRALLRDYLEADVNPLQGPPERPPIKHVIVAYGVDIPTERAYKYSSDLKYSYPIMDEMLVEDGENVWAVRVGRRSKQRKLHKKNDLRHSGDGLIPYLSLSWAHSWLGDDTVTAEHEPRVSKRTTFLDLWTPDSVDMSSTDITPAARCTSSRLEGGRSTTILELEGVTHHKITGDEGTLKIVFDLILGKMAEEMCLDAQPTECGYDDVATQRKQTSMMDYWGLSRWTRSKRTAEAEDGAAVVAAPGSAAEGAGAASLDRVDRPSDNQSTETAAQVSRVLKETGERLKKTAESCDAPKQQARASA